MTAMIMNGTLDSLTISSIMKKWWFGTSPRHPEMEFDGTHQRRRICMKHLSNKFCASLLTLHSSWEMQLDALYQKNIWGPLTTGLIDFWKWVCKLSYKAANFKGIFMKFLVNQWIISDLESFCVTHKNQWLSNLDSPLNYLSNEESHAILWSKIKILKIFRVCSQTKVRRVRGGTLVWGPSPNFLIDLWLLSPMATPCNPPKHFDEISILTSPPN